LYYTTKRGILKREITTACSQFSGAILCEMTLSKSFAGKKEGIAPGSEKKSGIEPAYPSDQKKGDDQKSRTRREEYAALRCFCPAGNLGKGFSPLSLFKAASNC